MTRDELEAEVWRIAGRRFDRADVAQILAAADVFAAAEGGVTAERRRVLEAEVAAYEADRRRPRAKVTQLRRTGGLASATETETAA